MINICTIYNFVQTRLKSQNKFCVLYSILLCKLILLSIIKNLAYHKAQILAGEIFDELNVTHQYFTQPNSRFTKVANVSFCKFVNIFLA